MFISKGAFFFVCVSVVGACVCVKLSLREFIKDVELPSPCLPLHPSKKVRNSHPSLKGLTEKMIALVDINNLNPQKMH